MKKLAGFLAVCLLVLIGSQSLAIAQTVSARIDSYSPSSKIEVNPGQTFTLRFTFTNTGNTAWDFWGGYSIWDVNGREVRGAWSASPQRIQPNQQGSFQWQVSLDTPGEYWLQFGVWKYQGSGLLDKKPSPSQNLIKVKPLPTISARIDSYYPNDPNNPVQIQVGNSTTISVTFTNTGNTAWNFIAGATVWDSNGNQVANYSSSSALQPGQQTTVSWTHTVNQAGDYWLQFGIWKDGQTLLDKKPSPSQRLIKGIAISCTDNATFVADVTVPDNTQMSPGQSFTKIWRLRNTGTCTWSTAYQLVFSSGAQMGAPSAVSIPVATPPNSMVDISVPMVAPSTAGTYTGYWRMRNASGQIFSGDIWVKIVVIAHNNSPIAEAAVSTSPTGPYYGYDNPLEVRKGQSVTLYFFADKDVNGDGKASYDPDGWTNPENGVSSGGKCEWNRDLNQGAPTFEETISSPSSAAACNIGPYSYTFNDAPGVYEYQVLRITDRKGAQSDISKIRIKVVASQEPKSIIIPDYSNYNTVIVGRVTSVEEFPNYIQSLITIENMRFFWTKVVITGVGCNIEPESSSWYALLGYLGPYGKARYIIKCNKDKASASFRVDPTLASGKGAAVLNVLQVIAYAVPGGKVLDPEKINIAKILDMVSKIENLSKAAEYLGEKGLVNKLKAIWELLKMLDVDDVMRLELARILKEAGVFVTAEKLKEILVISNIYSIMKQTIDQIWTFTFENPAGSISFQVKRIEAPHDYTPPVLTITNPADGAQLTIPEIVVSGTATDAQRGNSGINRVEVNGVRASGDTAAGDQPANWSKQIRLSPGPNSITVVAFDNSPQRNSISQSITANYVDSTPPTVTLINPKHSSDIFDSIVRFEATAQDDSEVDLVVFFIQSGNRGNNPEWGGPIEGFYYYIDDSVPYSATYDWSHLEEGAYGIGVSVRDKAGNWAGPVAAIIKKIASGPSRFTLTITKAGTGSGIVIGNPAGIDCGTTCSASFNSGTSVTLTATAASGSTFAGWSGCDSTPGNQCTVTMNANRTVTATFTSTVRPPTAPDQLRVRAVSSRRVDLSWRDRSNNEEGFRIYRNNTLIATVRANATSYSDTTAQPRTRYCYQVAAYNAAGEARSSQVCTTTPRSFQLGTLMVAGVLTSKVPTLNGIEFAIDGQGIAVIQVEVFDLRGRKVLDSGEVQGNTFTWTLQNNAGQRLANGVYLYVVRVRGFNDEVYVSAVRKLVIVR